MRRGPNIAKYENMQRIGRVFSLGMLFLLVINVGPGCSTEIDQGDLQWASSPIVSGTLDYGHPAVVMVGWYCAGTLIGHRTVLTAAHCLTSINDMWEASIWVGDTAFEPEAVIIHPEYLLRSDDTQSEFDVGLILLRETPPLDPIPLSTESLSLGDELTVVGFGATSADDASSFGYKRFTHKTVARVSDSMIYMVGGFFGLGLTCFGDSGGPLLSDTSGEERVVGIIHGGDKWCSIYEDDVRADIHLSWIKQAAEGDVFVDNMMSPLPEPDPEDPVPSSVTDTQPPYLAFITPEDKSIVPPDHVVEVHAYDEEEIAEIHLYVDDQLYSTI